MRILYVLENYHPHIGGVEIVFKHLCEGMARRGHQVTVVTHRLPGTPKKEVLNGVTILRVPSKDSRYLFTLTAVPAVFRATREADIVHTTTYNGAFPAWIGAFVRRKPSLITVHETWIGRWKEFSNMSSTSAWLHDMLERLVYRVPRFDRYVCVSHATAHALSDVIPKRKNRISTIHNGFSPDDWELPRASDIKKLRKHLGLGNAFVVFGYGRPGTSKGFEYLVDAMPFVKKRIPDARLVLLLSTDAQYRKKISHFKKTAPNDTIFLPPQPYKELPTYVQMADCVVVPSLSEGFGYTVLEATAAGTPVVATQAGSIPEVIGGEHVLVTPRSAHAIADGIVKVRHKGHKKTPPKRFPWNDTIAKYEKLYSHMLINR